MSARAVLWAVALVLLGAIGWQIHADGYERGVTDERAVWVKKERTQLEEHTNQIEQARLQEQAWRERFDQLTKEKDHEIERVNANVDRLLVQLRERASRPGPATGPSPGVPAAAQTVNAEQGCGGDRLYRDDGEFLARFAGICAKAQAELMACANY